MDKPVQRLTPTPKRGVLKGIIIILFAILIYFLMSWGNIGRLLTASSYGDRLTVILPIFVTTGFLLWQGIRAIVKRNKEYVSAANITIWAVLFVGLLGFMAWVTKW